VGRLNAVSNFAFVAHNGHLGAASELAQPTHCGCSLGEVDCRKAVVWMRDSRRCTNALRGARAVSLSR